MSCVLRYASRVGVALVVDVTDGIVHLQPLRGSVSANIQLLDGSGSLAGQGQILAAAGRSCRTTPRTSG